MYCTCKLSCCQCIIARMVSHLPSGAQSTLSTTNAQPSLPLQPRPTDPLKVQARYLCRGEMCSVRVTHSGSATICTGCLWVQGGGTAGANASCARTSGRPAGKSCSDDRINSHARLHTDGQGECWVACSTVGIPWAGPRPAGALVHRPRHRAPQRHSLPCSTSCTSCTSNTPPQPHPHPSPMHSCPAEQQHAAHTPCAPRFCLGSGCA